MSAALRRGATFAAGLVILCFGIVLNTKTGLGVASINTAPYTFSQVEGISLGTATMLLYFIFAGAQCLLRRSLGWKIILQIPMSVLIGRIVDFFNDYVLTFQAKGLADGLLLLCCAIPLTALGTTLVVQTDLVPAAPDGVVRAFGDAMGWDFGRAKYTFDIVIIILSAAYALVRTGHTVGIGIGTVAAALLTGRLCQLFGRLLAPWFQSCLAKTN